MKACKLHASLKEKKYNLKQWIIPPRKPFPHIHWSEAPIGKIATGLLRAAFLCSHYAKEVKEGKGEKFLCIQFYIQKGLYCTPIRVFSELHFQCTYSKKSFI